MIVRYIKNISKVQKRRGLNNPSVITEQRLTSTIDKEGVEDVLERETKRSRVPII